MLYYLIAMNLIAFIVYGLDKYKAVHHKWRIRESVLILLASAGGAAGALLGMLLFHHKVRKPKFYVGVPALLLLWSLLLWYFRRGL
ncbi:MAG: DUF1294 domain-containing protein [Lachnospiraceae bacterium]|nr:DUF1294 domain-containing protein [Lachnospiraceae bacterium]